MPELTTFNWMIICLGFSCVTGIAVFFLKNLFTNHEKHNDDISDIQKEFATRNELNNATATLRGENKNIVEKLDNQEHEIHLIKQTYATKDDVKEIRAELRDETKALSADVAEIKKNCLTKDDFYRRMVDFERKQEKIYDFLLEQNGGGKNG